MGRVFQFQMEHNSVYNTYASHFLKESDLPVRSDQIPLLPIRGFKDAKLLVENRSAELFFRSSGTGELDRSVHAVADPNVYKKSISKGFSKYFDLSDSAILCYTPGYNENPESSLIWMLNYLVEQDSSGLSRFLELGEPIGETHLDKISGSDKNVILFGAAFGLLDLLEMESLKLPKGSSIIETGGMKTHRREMSKSDLRLHLSNGFGVRLENVHSEYGMCELLSQAYAIGSEWFTTPHWMNVTIRDPDNPNRICEPGEEGKIGVIDLANIYSCPFILTEDKGVSNQAGEFKVLGRWNSDNLRGCNFLIDVD